MISDKDIICISTIDWNFVKQRHQILMEMFARKNNRVIFLEHLGFAAQRIKDLPKIRQKIKKICQQKPGQAPDTYNNPTIITPLILPPINTIFNYLNKQIFLRRLSKRVNKICQKKPIVWTYSATASALTLIKLLSPKMVIYDCVYDALNHPEAPPDIKDSESDLLQRADLVFTDARYLFNLKKEYNRHIYQILPGVDFEHFHKPSLAPTERVPLRQDKKRLRLCSFGSIDSMRIDFNLIDFLAEKRPQWSIVMIGPIVDMKIPERITKRKNINWLGKKSYQELPLFLRESDILILPYKLNAFTRSIFPAKIFECLASGKPIVSTALPELDPFKDMIIIANAPLEFLTSIEEAYNNDNEEKKNQRILYAKNNSWQSRFDDICNRIESVLNK